MAETLDYLLLGFSHALTVKSLLLVVFGSFLGTWVGMLPGLGPATAIALLLPVTYGMDPTSAMIMLSGIYFGAMYGGSIASILINTPGDASSVMTTLDGYQMTRKGRGGAALFISAVGSFIGGTIGLIALTAIAVPIARFALRFGPPEYFALMVFALIATASLIQGSLIKGLLSLVLGLMIATVGIDLQSGSPRFTMGVIQLLDGVSLLAVIVGLFAVAEVFRNMELVLTRQWQPTGTVGKLWVTYEEWLRSRWAILRGSVLGFVVGVFPGAGGAVATLIAYSMEKRISSRPEGFGKGAIEGVASPESANNASVPGAMVPLLTLGIPGSASTAVLLGALMIYGLQPGPRLFTDYPEVAWGVIASLYIANVFLLVLNIPLIGIFVRLLSIPVAALNTLILLLALVGAYSLQNSIFDVWLVLLFGVLGYVMNKLEVPTAPLILAVALGGNLEQSLRQSLALSAGDWMIFFERPISVFLLVLTVLLLFGPSLFSRARSAYRNLALDAHKNR